MTPQPVLLLAFSNDQDAYLSMIVEEQKAIKDSLLDYVDKNYLQLRDVQHASTEDVFYLVNRYHNRVHLLHYGGHADGASLQLEKAVGIVQSANVKGIAGLLGTQQTLKLVFLNGCATQGQVKTLLDSGVGAVIATSVSIQDQQAQQFAAQFYQALATGSTLREAFLKAKAFLEAGDQAPDILDLDQSRGLRSRAEQPDKLPWGLYYKPEREAVLDWKLPTESPLNIDFGGDGAGGQSNPSLNNILVQKILPAIKDSLYVKELARKIIRERKAGDAKRKPTDAEKKEVIIRSYPAPVSLNLQELFSNKLSRKADEPRLQQLLPAYEETVSFLSFMMLSDLWDAAHKRRDPLEMEDAERLHLRAFFELNEYTRRDFDYFLLADALLKIARRNRVQFYVKQLNDYPKGWLAVDTLAEAHEHFLTIKTALEEDVPSRLIEAYCLESERMLSAALSEWHFLSDYKMAVIKNIEVQRIRNLPPVVYQHKMVVLDHTHKDTGSHDRWQQLDDPTDMESILLYREKLNDNLNLSPFLIDENALQREFNSKVYFFSHCSEEGLHYYLLENNTDTMTISTENFPYILRQFQDARRRLLNEEVASDPGEITPVDEDDITSLL
jgi:hypothetical protein